jgi:hypothetical protein
MLAAGSERYGRTLPVNAVCMAFTVGGSLLFPVFGLLFWSLSFIALPVALAEPDLPVPDVFRRTWDLSRGRRLPLLYLVTGVWALAELTGRMFEVLGKAAPGLPGWAMPSAHAVVTCLVEGFVTVVSVALYRAFAAAPPAGPAAWPR